LRALVHDLPFEVHEAGLLLILRTLPGSAHALANALDRTPWPEVVGTVAGDDTVFVACPDRASRQRVQQRLKRIVSGG
jgi:transcriptional regulator of arginine metabolism